MLSAHGRLQFTRYLLEIQHSRDWKLEEISLGEALFRKVTIPGGAEEHVDVVHQGIVVTVTGLWLGSKILKVSSSLNGSMPLRLKLQSILVTQNYGITEKNSNTL